MYSALAQVSEKFHLIDSPTITLYLPIAEGKSLVEDLQDGVISRSLFRKLGQYAINIYPDHLKKLLDAGAVQLANQSCYVLNDLSLYNSKTGLQLDIETGKGVFL